MILDHERRARELADEAHEKAGRALLIRVGIDHCHLNEAQFRYIGEQLERIAAEARAEALEEARQECFDQRNAYTGMSPEWWVADACLNRIRALRRKETKP